MNWKDAMVSMKPGSGTAGLELDRDSDEHDQSQTKHERSVAEGLPKDGQEGADGALEVRGTRGSWWWCRLWFG